LALAHDAVKKRGKRSPDEPTDRANARPMTGREIRDFYVSF
jgi:hypothetical protein